MTNRLQHLVRALIVASVLTFIALVSTRDAQNVAPTTGTARTDVAAQATTEDIATERRCMALGLILARIAVGADIEEDWTWRGAPYVVTEWNDALIDEMRAEHVKHDEATTWYADGNAWIADQVGECIAADVSLHGNPDDWSTDAAADDATAEGTDVLMIGYNESDAALWTALSDQVPTMYDDQGTNGYGAFMVPVGTTITVADSAWLATLDGWYVTAV